MDTYEDIVQEFQSQCIEDESVDCIQFISGRMISLVNELTEAENHQTPNLKQVRIDFSRNLVLFTIMLNAKCDCEYYKSFADLTLAERDFIRNEVLPVIYS